MKRKLLIIIFLLAIAILSLEAKKMVFKESSLIEEIVLTNEVTLNGKTVLTASPGGDFVAGTPAGCRWIIHLPFEEIREKSFKIIAVHPKTNNHYTEIEIAKIEDNSHIFMNGHTWIPSAFNIPIPGIWEFNVYIDGDLLGSVSFDVPSEK